MRTESCSQNPNGVLYERQRIAERIAGRTVRWASPKIGHTICPLDHACVVFTDDNPVPRFFCHHDRCQTEIREWNQTLRNLCRGSQAGRCKLTAEEKAAQAVWTSLLKLKRYTNLYLLPPLLEKPEVTEDDWLIRSPFALPESCENDWKLLVSGLYKPDDRLWIGELQDSGNEFFDENCFKTAAMWLRAGSCPGPQICPAIFNQYEHDQPGRPVYSRAKENVHIRPYMMIESDTIPVGTFANVVLHLAETLSLRAVVHTGGKSIHAWFDMPFFSRSEARYATRIREIYKAKGYDLHGNGDGRMPKGKDLADYCRRIDAACQQDTKVEHRWRQQTPDFHAKLEGLGCDPHTLRLNSTARLPGCLRHDEETGEEKGWQRLLYLNPKYPPQI